MALTLLMSKRYGPAPEPLTRVRLQVPEEADTPLSVIALDVTLNGVSLNVTETRCAV